MVPMCMPSSAGHAHNIKSKDRKCKELRVLCLEDLQQEEGSYIRHGAPTSGHWPALQCIAGFLPQKNVLRRRYSCTWTADQSMQRSATYWACRKAASHNLPGPF